MDLLLKSNGIDFELQWFHFFNTLYSIYKAVTYSFTITYLEYFSAGNFRLKISTIRTIHAKFKQYKIFTGQHFKGEISAREEILNSTIFGRGLFSPV